MPRSPVSSLMRRVSPGLDTSCIVLATAMSALVILASSSGPPVLSPERLAAAEDGMTVTVLGMLVSYRSYDTGSESLLLADPRTGAVAKAICSEGILPMPGTYLSIGDEVRVTGEVSHASAPPVVFCTSDDVQVSSESEGALTVGLVCQNWALFIGDRFNLTGVVRADIGLMLLDTETERSIMLMPAVGCPPPPAGTAIVADCSLFMDSYRLEMYLLLHSFRLVR